MAGPLKTVLDEVNARIVSAVTGLATPAVGDEQLAVHGDPPRATWVPVRESIQPPDRRLGEPPVLWERRSEWELHLWARSTLASPTALDHLDAVEKVLESAARAIHGDGTGALTKGAYQVTAGRWKGAGDDVLVHGIVYILTVVFFVPITRAAAATVGPTLSLPTTMQVKKSDGTFESSHVQQVP